MKTRILSRDIFISVIVLLMVSMTAVLFTVHAEETDYGYVPIDLNISQAQSVEEKRDRVNIIKATSLPASYNAMNNSWFPDYIQKKDQGDYGICYAFAATSAAEISYSKEIGKKCIQTSPGHLAWYIYNTKTDPLGLTNGDYIELKNGKTPWTYGGSTFYTVMEMARGVGLAKYDSTNNPLAPTSSSYKYTSGAYSNTALSIENADLITGNTTSSTFQDAIKEAVYNYGGVSTAMKWDASAYKKANRAYYYRGSAELDHGVVIIGWDDSFSKTNFNNQPAGNGAWLVMNSWGEKGDTNLGFNKGTFYVSYYDTKCLTDGGWYFDMCAPDTYALNLQYDGGASSSSLQVPVTAGNFTFTYGANMFTVPDGTNLKLDAVSFTCLTDGTVKYDIEVYTDIKYDDPVFGTKSSTLKDVVTNHAGYHTFKLSSPLYLTSGTKFSVIIKPKSTVDFAIDDNNSTNDIKFVSSIAANQSVLGGTRVTADLINSGCCLRIKALGNPYTKYDLSSSDTTFEVSDQTYTGSPIWPQITVKYKDETLTEGVHYTVSYGTNTNIGEGTVTINSIKSRSVNSKTVKFNIVARQMSACTMSLSTSDYTYTGEEVKPLPTIKYGDIALVKGTDYELSYSSNKAVGKATVTATGKGKYTGTKSINFDIEKADISNATVSFASSCSYTGSSQTPSVTVKYNGKTLVSGTDYEIEGYYNNIYPGEAYVTISGKNSFEGKKKAYFTISKCNISNASVTLASYEYTYSGNECTPAVTEVKVGGKTLTYNIDYSVAYSNNKDAGDASVVITGKGYYEGTKAVKFAIKKVSLSRKTAKLSYTSAVYNGKDMKPTVTISGLKNGTDYTVSYSNNKCCGKATVKITGKGNYSGTITKYFSITPAKAALSKVTAGSKKITVAIKSQKTSKVTGYEISYAKSGSKAKTTTVTSTSKTLTGLTKGKKYTVKVRAYTIIDKKKVYGSYSASKTVKVK